MTNITGSSGPDFGQGFSDSLPDGKSTALGYMGLIAGYLLFKGKKKK